MRIVCPACAAAYEVPDGRLSAGRVVRCARCDTDWAPLAEALPPAIVVEPEPELVAPEIVAVPEPAIMPPLVAADDRPEVTIPAKQGGAALRAAWVLSVALVFAGVWFAYSAKDAVMRAWPPSVRVYAALGLAGER